MARNICSKDWHQHSYSGKSGLMPKTSISWKSIWIYLKSQIEFWSLKIESKSEKVLSPLKIYFKCGLCRVVPCACIQVYHVIRFNTHTWQHSVGSMFEINFQNEQENFRFELNFQISKLDLRFQINSNGFSRHRSFRHNFFAVSMLILHVLCEIKYHPKSILSKNFVTPLFALLLPKINFGYCRYPSELKGTLLNKQIT